MKKSNVLRRAGAVAGVVALSCGVFVGGVAAAPADSETVVEDSVSVDDVVDEGAAAGSDDEVMKPAALEDEVEKPPAPMVGAQTVAPGGLITGSARGVDSVEVSSEFGVVVLPVDGAGKFSFGAPSDSGEYEYSAVAIVDGVRSVETDFTVRVVVSDDDNSDDDGDVSERSIDVSPEKLFSDEFVKRNAVLVSVGGFAEDDVVRLRVAGRGAVAGLELNDRADSNGEVVFPIYGNSPSQHSAYVGEYSVSVSGAGDADGVDPLVGSFSVVARDSDDGGSDNEVVKPAAPVIEDQTVAPGGDVVGSAVGAEKVEVVNEGETSSNSQKMHVDEDGEFSFGAPSDPGEYEYSAVAIADGVRSDSTDFTVRVVVSDDDNTDESDNGTDDNEDSETVVGSGSDDDDVLVDEDTDSEKPVVPKESSEKVVEDDGVKRGGSDDDDSVRRAGAEDRESLPYTGVEMTALAAGVALLVVGGAAVFFSRRKLQQ